MPTLARLKARQTGGVMTSACVPPDSLRAASRPPPAGFPAPAVLVLVPA